MRAKDLPVLELSLFLSMAAGAGVLLAVFSGGDAGPASLWLFLPAMAAAFLAAAFAGAALARLRAAIGAEEPETARWGGVIGRILASLARSRARERELSDRVLVMLDAASRGDSAPDFAAVPGSVEQVCWQRINALLAEPARRNDERDGDVGRLASISSISGELERGADVLVELRDRLGEATRESAQNMQSIAAAVEELSAAVGEISRNTSISAEVARRCVQETEESRRQAELLGEAAGRISSIVETIRQIADQTTLLALNATIEAARAGTAGRSFAVVANEVKALAQQTATATEDIDRRIEQMTAAVTKVTSIIETIRNTAGEADQAATGIASAVEEQNAVIDEIAERLQRASDATRSVDGAVNDDGSSGGSHLEGIVKNIQKQARELAGLVEEQRSGATMERAA